MPSEPTSPWNITRSGSLDILDPKPEQIDIEDIAHCLNNICRFAGATSRMYSVLEHSLRVCWLLKHESPKVRLAALLHDASEAYFQDIPADLKHLPGMSFYIDAERKLMGVIGEKFGFMAIPLPLAVHKADKALGIMELLTFFPHTNDIMRQRGQQIIEPSINGYIISDLSERGINLKEMFLDTFKSLSKLAA